jgi:hypothetical protein
MSTSLYALSAAVVASGASITAALRYSARKVTEAAAGIQQSFQLAVQSISVSLERHQSSLASNDAALSTFAKSIPAGAKVYTHAQSTTGAKTLRESHTVEFK